MHLRRLELLGFKSFPDKTVIKLLPGVTAIVGPNGCGKTNILDSIRWVLGEQKVSLLRGTKMEEIIFNGTRDMKPLGMAEVTLVIQNTKGILPTEYSEVQITRRLFRSGESEYLLNKVPCRLKDIADLLMDTGIGAHVYSVIQQDMIDAILSDRAEERRFLFEEAAGISKYKNRKRAAIRKLEATQQDLLRLKDIVAEVNTQVNSLSRQMKKAERYQKIAEELKGWDIFLNRTEMEKLRSERQELTTHRESLNDSRLRYDTDIDTLSAKQEEERKQLIDLDRQLNELSNRIYEKSEAGHSLEKEVTILGEKRENARRLKEKNIIDIEAFARRRDILLEQIDNFSKEVEKTGKELQELQNQISENESCLTEADEHVLSSRQTREELSRNLMLLEGQLSAGKSDGANLREQEAELNSRLSELESLHSIASRKKTELLKKISGQESTLVHLREQINDLRHRQSEVENAITLLSEKSDELSCEIFELSSAMEAAEARRHLLTEMITQYEGYGAGVVAAFENKDNWAGLMGTLADNITPKSGFEDTIETALGEMAGYLICRDRMTADDIIAHLRREKKGRVGIITMDRAETDLFAPRPQLNDESFLGWADEYVTVSDAMRPLAHLLLSRIAVVRPENYDALIESLPPFYSVVTTEGKMYQSKSIITGGSNEGLSLFGRREKVAEQEKILSDISARLVTLKESRNDVTSQLGGSQSELKRFIAELDAQNEEYEKIEREITSLKYELQTAESDLGRIEKERNAVSEKSESLKTRQYTLTLNYDQLAREKNDIVEKLGKQESDISEREAKSDEVQKRLSGLQISQIEHKSKMQQLESQIRHTGELISEIEIISKQKQSEISSAEIEVTSGLEKIAILEHNLKEVFDARTEFSNQQTQIRQGHGEMQQNLDNREKEIKALRHLREEIVAKLHSVELRLTEIESETRGTIDKINNEYDIDIEMISVEPPDAALPAEKRVEHMHDLKEIMKSFGAVNLLALEEYKSSKERQEFLTTQLNDLLNAKSTLESTISKINVAARNLFLSTFDDVRDNFKKVFEELFTGGDADIRLLEESDPLESPIEIIARPRGKKLLSIAQMSGGERALTAISLLLAIYLVKPSPFCILDEIDAPLDDANIHRFLKMIKTFSDQTQFIIITHNKITMEAADVLYGITMEHPGISRVVSVRFNEESENGLVNTSMDDLAFSREAEIPQLLQKRISAETHIDSSANIDDN